MAGSRIMYRAVLLCALVLLVAAPSITSVQAASVKGHGAAGAAGTGAADTLAARLLERAGRALLAEAGDAAAAKPVGNAASEAKKPAVDAAKGDAAAAAPAAAAPAAAASKDAAAQQPAQEQPKAATPTVTQPASPQPPVGEQQQAAAQEEEEATAAVASVDSRGEAVRPMYYEPGVSRSGYRGGAEYDSQHPYAPRAPYTDYRTGPAPHYGGAAPYRQPGNAGYGPGSYNNPQYKEYDGSHGEYEPSHDGKHDKKHVKEEETEKEKEKHEEKRMHHTGDSALGLVHVGTSSSKSQNRA